MAEARERHQSPLCHEQSLREGSEAVLGADWHHEQQFVVKPGSSADLRPGGDVTAASGCRLVDRPINDQLVGLRPHELRGIKTLVMASGGRGNVDCITGNLRKTAAAMQQRHKPGAIQGNATQPETIARAAPAGRKAMLSLEGLGIAPEGPLHP